MPLVSRGRRANPVLTYETALRRFWAMHRTLVHANGEWFYQWVMAIRRWRQPPKDGCIIIAPGWLAYLGAEPRELIYRRRAVVEITGNNFSKLSQRPAIGSGVPPAREMRRMRSAYWVTEKCRRSATMPMWRWHFYNRSSAVVACATESRGRQANPVLTY